MARNAAEGVSSYAAWAPPGWTFDPRVHDPAAIEQHVVAPGFLGWIAAPDTAHVAAYPAPDEPGAVHLMHLFVTPSRQGTGLAAALLDRAVEGARVQGATSMRLRTPRGNARGLAFYRREGWGDESDAGLAPQLGLDVVWLRRPL